MREAGSFLGDPIFPTPREAIDAEGIRAQFSIPGDNDEKHLGEAETMSIILNRHRGEAVILTDDKAALRFAKAEGIRRLTTWDVIKMAVRTNHITPSEAWTYARALRAFRTGYDEVSSWDAFRAWCDSPSSISV
jgi:hypothetical protein